MDKLKLTAKKRTSVGRKVKQLRKTGLLPGNIYGRDFKSQAVELPVSEFKPVYKKAGETKIVELSLGEKDVYPTLIHNVQIDPLTQNPLHTDFFKVDLSQKIRTEIPVELIGTSPAVAQKIGLLLQTLNEVDIEALPTDLPEKLTLNVESLTQLDQEFKVSDLKLPKGVTILTDKNLGVVKVGKLVSKEAETLAKEEEAQAAAAKAQAAAQAGTAAPTEAQATTESAQTPTQPSEKPEAKNGNLAK